MSPGMIHYPMQEACNFFSNLWIAKIIKTYADVFVAWTLASIPMVFGAYLDGFIDRDSFLVALWIYGGLYCAHPIALCIRWIFSTWYLGAMASININAPDQHVKYMTELKRAITYQHTGPLLIMALVVISTIMTAVVFGGYTSMTSYCQAWAAYTIAAGLTGFYLIVKEHTTDRHTTDTKGS